MIYILLAWVAILTVIVIIDGVYINRLVKRQKIADTFGNRLCEKLLGYKGNGNPS